MATIKPLDALRFTPKAGPLEELTCPPYDIIGEDARKAYLARNPHNIIRLELPKDGETPYRQAGETLRSWLNDDILACDVPALYIYEEEFAVHGEKKRIRGLTCRVRLEEFSKQIVLPHEETLSKAKDDRFQLMCATGCNFSAIYSLYFDKEQTVYPRIEKLSAGEPEATFTSPDDITHRIWKITDPAEIQAIADSLADKKLYIADGHHRYETGLRYQQHLKDQGIIKDENHPGNYIMMTLMHMEHPGLVVQPTHRIVKGLERFDVSRLLEGCKGCFDIEAIKAGEAEERIAAAEASGKKAMALYAGGNWTLLTLESPSVMAELLPDKSDPTRGLDVSILHMLVLERLLGIDKENMANQKNLRYVRDIQEAVDAVNLGEGNCAFIIGPTKVEEIAAVAGAGEKMPQKSTYFYPKLITGHLMNKIL